MRRDESAAARPGLRQRWLAGLLLSLFLVGASAAPVAADDFDSTHAGHPLRIVAYVLHPIGVAIEYLILRPAHWLVSQEPMETLFGHEED